MQRIYVLRVGPPRPPLNVRVVAHPTNGSISVSWSHPPLIGPWEPVVGYNVTVTSYLRTDRGGLEVSSIEVRHKGVTGLELEVGFTGVCTKTSLSTVRVQARNQYGTSRIAFAMPVENG